MEKLFRVQLRDKEDGGHVLDEAFFSRGKEARDEFLRIRNEIFSGFYYDQPDEFGYRQDNHFTRYENGYFEVRFDVVKPKKTITYFDGCEAEYKPILLPLLEREVDEYENSIETVFDEATEKASRWCTIRSFRRGFKEIYDDVYRRLYDSFICCQYSKQEDMQEAQMNYFVKAKHGQQAVVTVSKDSFIGTYTFHITY